MKKTFLLFIFLVGCGPATLCDLRIEGEAETKRLAAELSQIENRDDLQKAIPRIKKRFNKMADLLIEAREFPQEECLPSFASEQLFAELARLYEIPGGRELIESAQMEAVLRLKR